MLSAACAMLQACVSVYRCMRVTVTFRRHNINPTAALITSLSRECQIVNYHRFHTISQLIGPISDAVCAMSNQQNDSDIMTDATTTAAAKTRLFLHVRTTLCTYCVRARVHVLVLVRRRYVPRPARWPGLRARCSPGWLPTSQRDTPGGSLSSPSVTSGIFSPRAFAPGDNNNGLCFNYMYIWSVIQLCYLSIGKFRTLILSETSVDVL